MKGPRTRGKQYLWPFQDRGACCCSQALEARKVSGFGFYLPQVHTPRRGGFQTLVLRFLHFLHDSTQNSEDLEKNINSCDPWASRAIGGPKDIYPNTSALCPLQNIQETHLCSCQTNHRPTAASGAGRVPTQEVDRRPGHLADAIGHRG